MGTTKTTRRSRARANPRNRALNALTVAENVSNRKDQGKGKWKAANPPSDDDDDASDVHPNAESGSDGKGNKYIIGHVNSDEDSELDSDEAMGESDEERFAEFTFRGSSTRREVLEEGSGAEDEEGEDDEEGGEDLLQILDRRMKEEEDEANRAKKKSEKLNGKRKRDVHADSQDGTAEDESEMEDLMSDMDELDELDEDKSEEDEEDEDDEDILSDSDGEEAEKADPARLSALHSIISSLATTTSPNEPRAKRPRLADQSEGRTPSEYNISLSSSSQKLSWNDLLPTITEPSLKQSLKLLSKPDKLTGTSGVPGKLIAPLPQRQQDRIDRSIAYDKAKEALSRWTDTVKLNREADHLHFPLPDTEATSAPGGAGNRLVSTAASTPFNPLEATISGILHESCLASEKQVAEYEALKTKKLSIEEVQKRTAQLRMARELLYREEIKAKRIKKIKSKAYRRIHKREREKQQRLVQEAEEAMGGGDLEGDEEKRERRRAEERMSLRHKQSRWAKGLQESGRAMWDEEARNDAVDMVKRGEELRRRIMGKSAEAGSDEDEDEDVGSEDEFDEEGQHKRLLRELEAVESGGGDGDDGTSTSKLMQMKFMQKAERAKRKANEEAMTQLREGLEYEDGATSDEEGMEEEEREVTGRRSFKPTTAQMKDKKKDDEAKQTKRVTVEGFAVSSDDEAAQGEDSEQEELEVIINTGTAPPKNPFSRPSAPSATTNNSDTHRSNGATTTRRPFGGFATRGQSPPAQASIPNPWLEGPQDDAPSRLRATSSTNAAISDSKTSKANAKLVKDRRAILQAEQDARDGAGEGDVLIDVNKVKVLGDKPHLKEKPNTKKRPKLLADEDQYKTTDSITSSAHAAGDEDASDPSDDEAATTLIPDKGKLLFAQRDLVRRAFAGDDVVAEFEADKSREIEEDETKEIDVTLPGWGSWSGAGINKHKQERNKGRFKKVIQGVEASTRKDAALKKVIISEKVIKKVYLHPSSFHFTIIIE